jgi:putative peptidoglycan lipid II flippase
MDIYIIASSIPTLFGGLLSAALSYSLTPHFIKMEYRLKEEYIEYVGQFYKWAFIIIFFISIVSFCLTYISLPFIYKTLDFYQIKLTQKILFFSWITFIFGTLFSINTSYFNSRKQYYLPLFLNLFPFLVCILITINLNPIFKILSVAIGMLIGTLVALFLSFYRIRHIFSSFLKSNIKFRSFFLDYVIELRYALVAMLCFTVYQTIDSFWASKLGSSNLSYLGYCQRILIAFGSLIIIGPSTVIIPRLTIAIQEKRIIDYLNDISLITKIVWGLSTVVALICSVLAKPIIKIMFERGAFTRIDTIGVSSILPLMFIGMTFMLCVVILFRALFVTNMIKQIAYLGIISSISYFFLSGLLSTFFDLIGIAYAYMITWVLTFYLSIYVVFSNRLSILFNKKNVVFFIKQIITLLCIYLISYFLRNILIDDFQDISLFTLILYTGFISIFSLASYIYLIYYILKIDEIRYLIFGIKTAFINMHN